MKFVLPLLIGLIVFAFSENMQGQQKTNATAPIGISLPDYPIFETVARSFFQKYQYRHRPFFILQKRPEGYFVVRTDEQHTPVADPQLFWSVKSRSYLPQPQFADPLPVREEDFDTINEAFSQREIEDNLRSYLYQFGQDRNEYDRQPYYGYRGWYRDVIELLEPQYDQLNNDQLNNLARAYSKAASSLLADNEGDADLAQQFKLPAGQNALTDLQVEQFRLENKKSAAAFLLVSQRDPDFMTPVGPIWTKYSNEIMNGFLNLLYFQNEKTARAQLQPNLYDDYLLQSARNVLLSCPPNAVLVTYGDTDTYPLLYLQATRAVRTDVLVVNHSLLALSRYYQCLKAGVFDAPALQSNLPDRFLTATIYLETKIAASSERTALDFFRELKTPKIVVSNPDYQLESAPAKAVLPATANSEACWKPEGKMMGLRELALLDIVWSNSWQRPLCFSLTCAASTFSEWQGTLALEGLVYRVFAEKLPKTNWTHMVIKPESSLDIWQNKLEFKAREVITPFDRAPFYFAQLVAGKSLAVQLLRQGDTLNAIEVASILETNFTNDMQVRGNSWIELAHVFGTCKQPEIAERIGLQIADNYQNANLPDYEMENKVSLLLSLDKLATHYNLDQLKKRLRNLR